MIPTLLCIVMLVGSVATWVWCERHTRADGAWSPWHRIVHNVVAHPLLVLCPPLGEPLHDRTAPPDVEQPPPGVYRAGDAWVCRGEVLPTLAGLWQRRTVLSPFDPPVWIDLDEHSGTGAPTDMFEVRPLDLVWR